MQYQSADKLPLYKTAEDHGGADLGGFVEVNFVKLKEADSTKPNIAQARQDADEEVGNDNCTKYFTNTDIASRLTELQRSHTAFKTRALGATA
jgi:poly-gamma-glutamate capsule biosynthesis protein CapA/YwtB (metallophosphatase superfamily)